MKYLCYIGILKEGFSPYSSPVMLISQKVMQDNRVVTYFRCLNVRIEKNSLAYPLVRDTCSVLRNSKCEVLSVLDLRDPFHSLWLSEIQKGIVVYCHILGVPHIYIKNAYGIKHLSFNLAIYINAILGCLQNRKHCQAIMDNLLLFTASKRHIWQS